MSGFPSPFGGSNDSSNLFDDYDEFCLDHIPTPGWFLDGHDILTDDEHVTFHETTNDVFEDRGVYDMTFGYNLARLNSDTRHPDAGYRYAEETSDRSVLRAEFTPTTPFCPQSDTLTKGSFRAWNDLSGRHEYDIVRVRVAEMHHRSDKINDALEALEANYLETGSMAHVTETTQKTGESADKPGCSDGAGTTNRGHSPDAPF
jgi:hypothetical protein